MSRTIGEGQEEREVSSVTIREQYKTDGGEWKETGHRNPHEVPAVMAWLLLLTYLDEFQRRLPEFQPPLCLDAVRQHTGLIE